VSATSSGSIPRVLCNRRISAQSSKDILSLSLQEWSAVSPWMNERVVKVCEFHWPLILSSTLLNNSESCIVGLVKLIKTELTHSQNCALRFLQTITTGLTHSGSNIIGFFHRISAGLNDSGRRVAEFVQRIIAVLTHSESYVDGFVQRMKTEHFTLAYVLLDSFRELQQSWLILEVMLLHLFREWKQNTSVWNLYCWIFSENYSRAELLW
jgi:hypothetical protein